jgi:hypothetical protein
MASNVIGPNSTLIFEVELISSKEAEKEQDEEPAEVHGKEPAKEPAKSK